MRSISSVVPKTDIELKDFKIKNEPVLSYLPGSQERQDLEAALSALDGVTEDIPIVIGGKEYRTEHVQYQPMVSISYKYFILMKTMDVCLSSVCVSGPICCDVEEIHALQNYIQTNRHIRLSICRVILP